MLMESMFGTAGFRLQALFDRNDLDRLFGRY
jgi:hypothetical protein